MPPAASTDFEVSILARVLADEPKELPAEVARYLLDLEFSARDKERMHDLAVRNQGNDLSDSEKQELAAYAKSGTIVSILKSKARRALKKKTRKRANC